MAKPKEKKKRPINQEIQQVTEPTQEYSREKDEGEEEQRDAEEADPITLTTAEKLEKNEKKKHKETLDVKIETFGENPDKISPIVGYFPSGYDPLRSWKEGEEAEPEAKVKVYKNKKRSNRLQLVVSPKVAQVNFVGTNYSGEATAAQMCTYGLGVFDKTSQTLKIVPIAANKIFRLEPRVAGLDLPENETPETLKHELTAEEKADKMRELTLMYSSKKTIRQTQKLESLRQRQDPESQQDLDQKLGGIEINKEGLEVTETTTSARNIPPHDLSATTPQTAYPLHKIIFSGEWDYLMDILEISQAGAEVTSHNYPSFVCNRVYKLDDITDEVEKRQLAGIFSYITHLVKFKDKHSMDGVSSAKHHKIPGILYQKFSSLFANSDSKRIADDKKDLLISYILVLTLYVDNFRTDLSDIAKDLRMNPIALRPHYEHLGCKLAREKQLLLATLSLPLQFPTVRRKRRR
ncbi:DNA-directed RNA polymerase I subunit rpa49 [Coffea eugenioides]|uniref:DNA-directed RNA polymerase I subunit rpa49 n=1 Tax=Coffea eugenioides TaxID=49369 RepID=UPI000F611B6B|nr:DNA-directed RNA polymerase I subunit rpa49 [Coffea eugenioides]